MTGAVFPPGFFERADPSPDSDFYRPPRLVEHIDARAIAAVGLLYTELGLDGDVLDLMASWISHFEHPPKRLVGLGMNASELAANPMLAGHVVHDLNTDPTLPFPDASFDAVACCVSVDYLVDPVTVFREVARVLRPGGPAHAARPRRPPLRGLGVAVAEVVECAGPARPDTAIMGRMPTAPVPAARPVGDHPVPVLTDGVVTLRSHIPADVDGLVAMATDIETVRWTSVPVPYDRRHAEHWVHEQVPAGWRDGSAFRWAVEAVEAGVPRFAGNLDLRAGPPPDIGFATAPWARRRGITARAVRLATRWAFDRAGLGVVHWSAAAGNLASWRVAHACGFTFHGEIPLALAARGILRDGWFASLRPGDEPAPRTTWWPVPVLEGPRVRLRPHTDADVTRIVEACTDERMRYWLNTLPDPYTEDTARSFVRNARLGESLGQSVKWAVADRDDDRLLANVSVFRLAEPMLPTGAEIGYWAHPDARGRGVVGEAVDLVLDHAFTPRDAGGLGRHRVQIGAAWSNSASRYVAERAGFTQVGRFRLDGEIGQGELDDGAWYDLLAADAARAH